MFRIGSLELTLVMMVVTLHVNHMLLQLNNQKGSEKFQIDNALNVIVHFFTGPPFFFTSKQCSLNMTINLQLIFESFLNAQVQVGKGH